MKHRSIPSTGEMLPIVGLGTYRGFDVGNDHTERARLADVVNLALSPGKAMIDSSPMYGRAEQVTGDILIDRALAGHAFLATKVWTTGKNQGIAQMEKSMRLFRTEGPAAAAGDRSGAHRDQPHPPAQLQRDLRRHADGKVSGLP